MVDVPYGLRGGIPEYGGRFAAQALVMATADGHPRAVAYVSRIPTPTLNAIKKNAFYSQLIQTQHFTFAPVTVPLTAAASAARPLWARKLSTYTPLTAAEVAAGRRDAAAAAYRVGRGVVLKSRHCAIFASDRFPLCLPRGWRFGLPAPRADHPRAGNAG